MAELDPDSPEHEVGHRPLRRVPRRVGPPRRLQHRSARGRGPPRSRIPAGGARSEDGDVQRRLADAHRAREASPPEAEPASPRRADEPPRPRGPELARGLSRSLSPRGGPGFPRSLLSRPRGHPHHRDRSPEARRLHRELQPLSRAERREPGGAPRAGPPASRRSWRSRSASSSASATRRPRRSRCRAGSRCSRRVDVIEVPPERKLMKLRLPEPERSGRVVMELTRVAKKYGDTRGLRGRGPRHRARRKARARGTERRREVDADAPPRADRGAGLGHGEARPQSAYRILQPGTLRPRRRQDRSREHERERIDRDGAAAPQHPRSVSVPRRRRRQDG